MTGTVRPRWNPDELAALEDQRAVLLRELRELDAQVAAGELSAGQHAELADELTSRAAEVISRIDRKRADRPRVRRSPVAIGAVLAACAVAAVLAGWALTTHVAPRVAPTAVETAPTADDRLDRLAAIVAEQPDDVPVRLTYARMLIQAERLAEARTQYDAIAAIDATNAEALTYGGWLAVLGGDVPGGIAGLERAVVADPGYPDAHALLGLARMRSGDDAGAVDELRRYLQLAPDGPLAGEVAAVIDRIQP